MRQSESLLQITIEIHTHYKVLNTQHNATYISLSVYFHARFVIKGHGHDFDQCYFSVFVVCNVLEIQF